MDAYGVSDDATSCSALEESVRKRTVCKQECYLGALKLNWQLPFSSSLPVCFLLLSVTVSAPVDSDTGELASFSTQLKGTVLSAVGEGVMDLLVDALPLLYTSEDLQSCANSKAELYWRASGYFCTGNGVPSVAEEDAGVTLKKEEGGPPT